MAAEDVTALLIAWNKRDSAVNSRLMALVSDDLRCVARRRLGAERVDQSLAPTALAVSAATVKRDWSRARAWLFRELNQRPAGA